MATNVKITLDKTFTGTAMKVYMCGQSATIRAGNSIEFECNDGRRLITVEILTSKLSLISYRLDFIKAQRWNSNHYVNDRIYGGEPKSFYVYVPGVKS
jgi:hypothetical protein